MRDVQVATVPLSALTIVALAEFSAPRWGIIVCAALLMLLVLDACWLTFKLKRTRSADSGQP